MAPESVLCVHCGFHRGLGQLQTEVIEPALPEPPKGVQFEDSGDCLIITMVGTRGGGGSASAGMVWLVWGSIAACFFGVLALLFMLAINNRLPAVLAYPWVVVPLLRDP